MTNEWVMSSEPLDQFLERNQRPASSVMSGKILSASDICITGDLPYLPIIGFEDANWEKMHAEARPFP
jgi:hypothetical protein